MNNHSVIPAFDFREMVQAKNGEVVTTSRKIAKYFGKRHGDVLRKIEQVKAIARVSLANAILRRLIISMSRARFARCTA